MRRTQSLWFILQRQSLALCLQLLDRKKYVIHVYVDVTINMITMGYKP